MNEHDFDGNQPRQLLVCTTGVDCARALKKRDGDATMLAGAIKEARTQAGLNRELYVIKTGCQGWCEEAPVCQLLPEGRIFKDFRIDEAAAVVQACLDGGTALKDRLVWDYSLPREENEKRRA
jgi:(2Fe-2S) ferredoxin